MKFAIYIPAYNAAATLPRVFERIPADLRNQAAEILVVDNCSKDDTSRVVQSYQSRPEWKNLTLIRNEKNEGYGGSQKIGYTHCISKGYDCVAMLHGDAQYAPELLGSLLEPVMKGEADLVFGSRMRGDPLAGGMPLIRYLGNRFLTTFQNIFLGQWLSEYRSGYRVFSTAALQKVPFLRCASDYHFDTEIIILFIYSRLRIAERPIPTHYGDEKNYVNIWKYGTDVLVTTLSYWLHKIGLRRSRNWSRILTSDASLRSKAM